MADQTPNKEAGNPVGQFGDPLLQINFDDPKKKQDKEYGRVLLQRIFKEQNNQSSSFYFGGRNIRWMENWQWSMGRQNMNEFTDYVSTEGNKAYAPVDMTQNRIGPQFLGVLIDSMSQNDEYACVSAVDGGSLSEKEQRKMDALFRMREVETINDVQQQTGVQLEPTDAYIPDDPLSAEVYFKLEDKLPKEIDFQEKLAKSMNDNQFKQKARQTKRDLIVLNCACTKVERADEGYIAIRKVTPANLIYNFFMSDSGQMELSYIGEVYSLKIKDLRKKFGKTDARPNGLSEKDIFEMSRTANQFNNANRFIYYWNESYLYATDRPYDDYGIQVFDCEIQTFDCDYYVSKEDSFGKENIQLKKGIPAPQSDKAKIIKKDKLTWYRGVWAVKADKMIYWGLPDLVIKPYMDISQSLSSYSIQIPNNDGDYVPSLFERGLSPLRKWTLCDLKVKQLIANLRPSGVAFDIEQMRDLDMGLGDVLSPMQMLKIYNQTGNIPYSSKGLNPMDKQDVPIHELANAGSAAQLQELSVIMENTMQELRSLWGVPLYRDGSDLPPRMGAAVVENQTTNSNNVTDFINFSDKCLWEETLHKVCLLHWDDVVLRGKEMKLMDTEFQVKINLKPTAYEKQMLEQNIQVGMKTIDPSTGKPLLTFKDAFKIRNIEDYKLAEMYLANTEDQNEKKNQADKAKREQANIQAQQESNTQASEKAITLQKDKLAYDERIRELTGRNKKEEILLEKGLEFLTLMNTPQKTTEGGMAAPKPNMPPELVTALTLSIQSVAQSLTIEMNKSQEQIQAEQMEKEQMMQAAAEQQMMQEQQSQQM